MMQHLKKLDWILIISALLLIGLGLLSLYSSAIGKGDFLNFQKQLIFLGVGLFLMFLFSFVDYRFFKNDPHLILILYFLCILALVGLFFLAPEIRGVKSWYKIGPISLDPSEFTRLVLILFLAQYFSSRHIELYRIGHVVLSGLYILLPAVLISLQPNLGSALILIILWLSILIISGIKLKPFFLLCLCGLLVVGLAWSFWLKDYQKERILSFINPQLDPRGASWSQIQARIAIGSGGILGKGFGSGSQTQYGFLPEPQTDFIFSAIAEEFGLLGISIIFLLFSILFWRIIKTALIVQSNFARLFASGFSILLAIQVFINIGMNLSLLPVIGIPLPLISYGGSSLVTVLVGLGMIQSIRSRILFHSSES